MAALEETGASREMQRAYRIRDQARRLRAELPDAITTPADERAFTVWWKTKERFWDAYGRAMGLIFDTELEQVDQEALDAIRRRDLGPLGVRVLQFKDFCETEVVPLLESLEKGLDAIAALAPGDPRSGRYRARYGEIRQAVRQALPVAWELIAAGAHMYSRLPDDLQKEAEGIWGPLTGTDPHDFSPVWHRHFPTQRLLKIDLRYRELTAKEEE